MAIFGKDSMSIYTIGLKIFAYNIIILMNQIYQRPKRKIMDVVV